MTNQGISLLTGNEVVDTLKVLQISVDRLDSDPDAKINHVHKILHQMNVLRMLGQHFMIGAAVAYGFHPDAPPDELALFDKGMTFIGELETYDYIQDEDIPIDALTMGFKEPEVWEATESQAAALRRLRLQVPVMAIDTCVCLEEAA